MSQPLRPTPATSCRNKPNINILSLSRVFLFGARDVWFEVPLPFFLRDAASGLGWSRSLTGAFMAVSGAGAAAAAVAAPAALNRNRSCYLLPAGSAQQIVGQPLQGLPCPAASHAVPYPVPAGLDHCVRPDAVVDPPAHSGAPQAGAPQQMGGGAVVWHPHSGATLTGHRHAGGRWVGMPALPAC